MKHILILITVLFVGAISQAQDFGVIGGIHYTGSSYNDSGGSSTDINAKLGYRFGLAAQLNLTEQVNFRSGLMYTNRSVNAEQTATTTDFDYELTYIDIPALFQFQMNDMISFYAGPVVAFNIGQKADGTIAGTAFSGDVDDAADSFNGVGKVESMYLLGQIGMNMYFDGIAFDVYYERGIGDITKDGIKDFSILGANVIYWF